ncbi:cytochrome c oxidase assembly protein [Pseudonocardia pini]|uniref:cytochrome c oxidase assembly protein n=1 Tax=Pseudonocardia pini TaxID=2758030 RepID=UPI0015EFE56C|nr:cytochrome c oxidase assembly protein [Pseudonocardia pini]
MGHDHGVPELPGVSDGMGWQTDGVSLTGTALIVLVAVGYLVLCARPGARSPAGRVLCLLGGLALLVVTLYSGIAAHGSLAAHVGQCLVVMTVVAPLVVAGRPGGVLLAALPAATRRELSETADDPLVRGFSTGRWAGVLLVVDYYGSMAVYVLTPLYRWSTEHLWLHVAAHVYFLVCGLVFWAPLLGPQAVGLRTALVRTLVGVPINAVIGVAVLFAGAIAPQDLADTQRAGWVFVVGGGLLSLVGAVVVLARHRRSRSPLPLTEEEIRWPAAS